MQGLQPLNPVSLTYPMTRSILAIRSTTCPPQTHNRLAPGHRLTTLPITFYLTLSRSTRPRFAQRRLFHRTLSHFCPPLRTTSTKWERISVLSLKASHRGNPTCSRKNYPKLQRQPMRRRRVHGLDLGVVESSSIPQFRAVILFS